VLDFLSVDFLAKVLSIIVIDLVLSGDNAVVIGMAARRLSPDQRRRAIIIGGGGAVVLRMIFTALAALLLGIPFLQAAGGLLLLWIAYKLLRPEDHSAHVSEAGSLSQAIKTIVLADVVMSLDNILAVGGAAHGHLGLLLFGLAFSIPLLLLGSELVARLLGRLPILVYAGAIVLVLTAVGMILEDEVVHDLHAFATWETALITLVVSAIIVFTGWRAQQQAQAAATAAPGVQPWDTERPPEPGATDSTRLVH
jgi:YjbE family integral membrane protein